VIAKLFKCDLHGFQALEDHKRLLELDGVGFCLPRVGGTIIVLRRDPRILDFTRGVDSQRPEFVRPNRVFEATEVPEL
jgi:hypothetical protein